VVKGLTKQGAPSKRSKDQSHLKLLGWEEEVAAKEWEKKLSVGGKEDVAKADGDYEMIQHEKHMGP